MFSKKTEFFLLVLTILTLFFNAKIFIIVISLLFCYYLYIKSEKVIPVIIFLIFTEMSIFSISGLALTFAKVAMLMILVLSFKVIKEFKFHPIFVLFSVFSLYLLIYFLFSFNKITFRWIITLLANMLFIVLLYEIIISKKNLYQYLIIGLFIAVLANSFLAIYQEISHGHTLFTFGINNDLGRFEKYANYIRVSGFFQNSNLLNALLIPVSMFIFPEIPKKFRILFLFPFLAFLFTFSRSAWLIVGFSLVVLAFFYNKKVFIGLFLLILIFLFTPFSKRFFRNDALRSVYYSNLGREYSYKIAEKFIKKNWIFGIGPGELYENFAKYAPEYLPWKKFFTHNTYLSIFGELGILGITMILSILAWSFFNLFKIKKKKKIFYLLGSFLLIFLSFFFDLQWELQFWMVILLSMVTIYYEKARI